MIITHKVLLLFLMFAVVFELPLAVDEEPRRSTEIHRLGKRVVYTPWSSTVRIDNLTTDDKGLNPTLSDVEVSAICDLPDFKVLTTYDAPIDNGSLEEILDKHELTHVVLAFGRDETCALLSRYESLKSIAILDGDVTQAGLMFLKKLKGLESISINTRSTDRIVMPCAARYFPGVDCNISLYDTVLRQQDKSGRGI